MRNRARTHRDEEGLACGRRSQYLRFAGTQSEKQKKFGSICNCSCLRCAYPRFWSPVDSPSWKVSGCPGLDRAQESTGGRAGNTATGSTNESAGFGHLILSTNGRRVLADQWEERWSRVNITAACRDSRRRKLQFLRFQSLSSLSS